MISCNWSTTIGCIISFPNIVTIQVDHVSEELNVETDVSYSLIIPAIPYDETVIKAKTVYGTLYAMEVHQSSVHRVFVILNAPGILLIIQNIIIEAYYSILHATIMVYRIFVKLLIRYHGTK